MSILRRSFLTAAVLSIAALAPIGFLPIGHADQPTQKSTPRQARKNDPFAAPKVDPTLPNVLLIGDSISIGYMLDTRRALAGKANVFRPGTNCGPTTRGLEQLDSWLGDRKWDVIHFNFGLHDLKFMGPNGKNLADPKLPTSKRQVPLDEYVANLETIAKKLKATGATVIWRETTPVPEGAGG
ncbi:MAG: SGNH/GDSL hydrolase family protein, partial [Rhodopirellula bahusiensis]